MEITPNEIARYIGMAIEFVAIAVIVIGVVEALIDLARVGMRSPKRRVVWLNFARWLVAGMTTSARGGSGQHLVRSHLGRDRPPRSDCRHTNLPELLPRSRNGVENPADGARAFHRGVTFKTGTVTRLVRFGKQPVSVGVRHWADSAR